MLGGTNDGKLVVDTSAMIPKSITKAYSLQRDFCAGRNYLDILAEKYGVKLNS